MILIRKYRPDDLDVLAEIDRICFEPGICYSQTEMRFCASHPSSVTLVAEVGKSVAGFAVGRVEGEGIGHVITVDVLPQQRRCGVGKTLMLALHAELESRGARTLYLEVDRSNIAALELYRKLGYSRLGTLEGYYGSRRDAYRMARSFSVSGQSSTIAK